jgi:hypothetical protein
MIGEPRRADALPAGKVGTADCVLDANRSSRRKESSPPPHDVLVRPTRGDLGIKSQQQVQMIIQHRKPADGHREDLCKLLDPIFNNRLNSTFRG